jgi:hypothetical protein
MSELIGGLVEALSGYLVGRFHNTKKSASHISRISISLMCGLIFFIGYGIQSLIFPSPHAPESWGYGLVFFSLAVSTLIYLMIMIDFWLERKE